MVEKDYNSSNELEDIMQKCTEVKNEGSELLLIINKNIEIVWIIIKVDRSPN